MRPRPILTAAALVVLACALFFARSAWSRARQAAEAHSRAELALADARARLQTSEVTAAAAARSRASGGAGPARAEAAASVEAVPSGGAAAVSAGSLLARRLAAYRDGIDKTWGLLIAQLGLSASEAEAFRELLYRREENDLILDEKAKALGVREDSPQMAALDDAFLATWKTQLRQLLGESGYAAYRDYYRDNTVAPLVTEMVGTSYDSNSPMSLDEASKLLHALANACERKPSGKALPDTLNWAKAKDLARTVLSAEHDAAFETMASRIQSERQVDQYLKRIAIMMGADGL
jgi:hypothetical protein